MFIRIFLIALLSLYSLVNTLNAQRIKETGSAVTLEQAQEALDFHNKARAEVGVPPLQWSSELASYAQDWADYLASKKDCNLIHRSSLGKDSQNYGENIFWSGASSASPVDASKSWYDEKAQYEYAPILSIQGVGHYTQMVWRDTEQVGIGIANCEYGIIIVANYAPAGNYIGEYPY